MFRSSNKILVRNYLEHRKMNRNLFSKPIDRRNKWFTKASMKGRIRLTKVRNNRYWKLSRRKIIGE